MHLHRAMKDVNNNKPQRCLLSTEPLQSTDFEADDDDDDAAVMLDFPLGMDPECRIDFAGSANGLVCLVIDVY